MVEAQERTESQPVQQPEILDVNGFGGLYARTLLASYAPEETLGKIITTEIIEDKIEPAAIDLSKERHYNKVTQRLSSDERQEAWKGIEFNLAYKNWRTQITDSINNISDEKRAEAVKLLSKKEVSEFTKEDADKIYEDFCKGKSDTSGFVRAVVSGLEKDGKVDAEKMNAMSSHIEWFAANLFGKQTAGAVSKIIELEADIVNNKDKVVDKLFADKERINNLTEEEKTILTRLHKGLDTGASEKPADTRPEPDTTSQKQQEEVIVRKPLTPTLRELFITRYRSLDNAAVPPEINSNLLRQLRINDFTTEEIEHYKKHPDELMRELDKRMTEEDEEQSKSKSNVEDIAVQPNTVSQQKKAINPEPLQPEKSGATKRPKTRLRVHPITGTDLIRNNKDGKIYTVVGRSKDDTTNEEQVHIKSPEGTIVTYSKKDLEKLIDLEGSDWDIFEPVSFDTVSLQPMQQHEVSKTDTEEKLFPPPINLDTDETSQVAS